MECSPDRAAGFLMTFVAAALLLVSVPASAGHEDWRQMTVGHFQLYSTLRESQTRDVARQLQAFENTVGEMLKSEDHLPDVPTWIFILNEKDFRRYTPELSRVAGVFYERPFANLILIDGDQPFDFVKLAVFHEYTHFIERNQGKLRLPPWYVEGYAELFSSFELKGNKVTIGHVPTGLHVNLNDWIPMDRLLAVNQNDKEYRAERLAPQFYGESWALVHLLLFDDKDMSLPVARYLSALEVGDAEDDAFSSSFHFSKSYLDAAVHKLIIRGSIVTREYTYLKGIAVDAAPVTPMSDNDANYLLARVMVMLGRTKELVWPILDSAQGSSHQDPRVDAVRARVLAARNEPNDLDAVCANFEKGGSDSPFARIDLAYALLADNQSVAHAKRAMSILNDIVHQDAPLLEAVALWADAAARVRDDFAATVPVLEAASARAPRNTQLLGLLAWANLAKGDKAKARYFYNRIILVSPDERERLWAQKRADSAELSDGVLQK